MKLDRRSFLRAGATAATAAAATGCDEGGRGLGAILSTKDNGPFKAPTATDIDPVAHVLNRLSFGASPGEYQRVRALASDPVEAARAYLDEQLAPEHIDDSAAERALRPFAFLKQPAGELFEYKEQHLLEQLVHATILRATLSRRQLYEVMVQFWTDHFNIDPSKGDCRWLKAWDDQAVIRRYALGDCGQENESMFVPAFRFFGLMAPAERGEFKFPDFLRASATSPAMLWYLDGRVNRRANGDEKPNENYARELLELHSLGVHGGYTQQDVMEVARCLTGWTVRGKKRFSKAAVEFNPRLHDDGEKTVLGNKIPAGLGAKDLDRVIEIIALHEGTAKFIATKLCRHFIADDPSASSVGTVARAFVESGGDIRATLRAMFDTLEFWSSRGTKFKRPFHFVVSALRATDAPTAGVKPIAEFLQRMGHLPFHYPTPDGYPEEPSPWMGTLLWRWNFAVKLTEGRLGKGQPRLNGEQLLTRAGGDTPLMAHLLGRAPTAEEMTAYKDSGMGLALGLASPAFQYF